MQSFIETGISVILLFLTVSIIVTAINEMISRLLRLRGAVLFDGIKSIIDNETLRKNFYSSGVIFSVAQAFDPDAPKSTNRHNFLQRIFGLTDRTGHPSYIDARNFSKALVQAILRPEDGNPIVADFEALKAAISGLPKGRVKDVLVSALNEGVNDIKGLEAAISKWYDTATERLSGRYKRWKQTISFVIGVLLAVGLNINALDFVARVETDANLRHAIVTEAVKVAGQTSAFGTCDTSEPPETPGDDGQSSLTQIECYADLMSNALGDLDTMPIGWTRDTLHDFEAAFGIGANGALDVSFLLKAFIGWFVTAMAVTLGAPFWFDLLKKFVNIRSSGNPPKKAEDSA
ncbi:MAG: hypothetical protein AAGP08_15330 [Pseudomonadota bacterium]